MTDPLPLEPRPIEHNAARRARFVSNSFEVWLAIACLLVSISFFAEPDFLTRSPIGIVAPAIRYAWVSMLLASAVSILSGLYTGKANLEVMGCVFLASSAMVNTLAVIEYAGVRAITGGAMYLGVAWASAARAMIIVKYSPRSGHVADE